MTSKNELSSWLEQTERIIRWVISNVPSDRLFENPPHSRHPYANKGFKTYFGEWPALRCKIRYKSHSDSGPNRTVIPV
jgi:hypothetical protein